MTLEWRGQNVLKEIERRLGKARRTVRLRAWTYELIQGLGIAEYKCGRARTYLTASLWSGAGAVILAAFWFFTGAGSWGYPAGAAVLLAVVAQYNFDQRREQGENADRYRGDLATGRWPPMALGIGYPPYDWSLADVSVVEVDMNLDAISEIIVRIVPELDSFGESGNRDSGTDTKRADKR